MDDGGGCALVVEGAAFGEAAEGEFEEELLQQDEGAGTATGETGHDGGGALSDSVLEGPRAEPESVSTVCLCIGHPG
jgi:hypothetical protein